MKLRLLAMLLVVHSHGVAPHVYHCRGFTYQRLHEAPSPNPNCYSGPPTVSGWV